MLNPRLLLLITVLLSGCATTANYEKKLQTWVGVSEDSLYTTWGVPSKQLTLKDGSKIVEFFNSRTVQLNGYSYIDPQITYHTGTTTEQGPTGTTNTNYIGSSTTYIERTVPAQNIQETCKTTFIINPKGLVSSWKWDGNNCVSE